MGFGLGQRLMALSALAAISSGCGHSREYKNDLDSLMQPAGTLVAAKETNATHCLTLNYAINGYTSTISRKFFFRKLAVSEIPMDFLFRESEHGDGASGWYSLSISPDPSQVFKDNAVSFAIEFVIGNDLGYRAEISGNISVPLLKSAHGVSGKISYNTEWFVISDLITESSNDGN